MNTQYSAELIAFLEMAQKGEYLILDTETTGLHDGEICQIAIIDGKGEILLDTLVKTTFPIPADATRIHGITDAMVRGAPSWAEIQRPLYDTLAARDLIVYNAVYDRKMMHQSAEKARLEKTDWKLLSRWWCAMEAFAEVYGEWNEYHGSYRWQPLHRAARHYGFVAASSHNALVDCQMTLAVVQGMCKAV